MERGESALKREYLDPAMNQIANELDSRCSLWAYQNTNNIVGALGTTPTTILTYLQARQRLNELSCPAGERGMIVSPGMESTLIGTGVQSQFNPQADVSRQYKEGSMGRAAGFDWYSSNNLYDHTAGTWAAACTVQTTPSNGATSVVVGGTLGQTFVKGDVFNFSASYACNPVSRRSVGFPKQFVVTETLTLTGGTTDSLKFQPANHGPGSPYQNVYALPVGASATITNSQARPRQALVRFTASTVLRYTAMRSRSLAPNWRHRKRSRWRARLVIQRLVFPSASFVCSIRRHRR